MILRHIGWLACVAVALSALTGCSSPTQFPAAKTGKCRYVTPAEMEKITGLPVIKPVETIGTCEYLYSADATEPTVGSINSNNVPPSVSIQYETDPYSVNAVGEDISRGIPVAGLGVRAAWDSYYGELDVRLKRTAIRIMITAPTAPQHFRTANLQTIAIAVFRVAEPRLNG